MPNYDIYVLSNLRDQRSINHFIEQYCNRTELEDRTDEELMVLPLGVMNEDNMQINDYDWIPAINIENVINIGTNKPVRAFRFYLPSTKSNLSRIILAFTSDNKIIYGISIEIEEEHASLINAEEILKNLYEEYKGINGGIFYEEPPSLDSTEFIKVLGNKEKHCLRVI